MKYGLLKQAEKDPCQFLVTYRSTVVSLAELTFKQTSFDSPWSDMMARTRERTFAPEDKFYTKMGFEKQWAAATVKGTYGQVFPRGEDVGGTWVTWMRQRASANGANHGSFFE